MDKLQDCIEVNNDIGVERLIESGEKPRLKHLKYCIEFDYYSCAKTIIKEIGVPDEIIADITSIRSFEMLRLVLEYSEKSVYDAEVQVIEEGYVYSVDDKRDIIDLNLKKRKTVSVTPMYYDFSRKKDLSRLKLFLDYGCDIRINNYLLLWYAIDNKSSMFYTHILPYLNIDWSKDNIGNFIYLYTCLYHRDKIKYIEQYVTDYDEYDSSLFSVFFKYGFHERDDNEKHYISMMRKLDKVNLDTQAKIDVFDDIHKTIGLKQWNYALICFKEIHGKHINDKDMYTEHLYGIFKSDTRPKLTNPSFFINLMVSINDGYKLSMLEVSIKRERVQAVSFLMAYYEYTQREIIDILKLQSKVAHKSLKDIIVVIFSTKQMSLSIINEYFKYLVSETFISTESLNCSGYLFDNYNVDVSFNDNILIRRVYQKIGLLDVVSTNCIENIYSIVNRDTFVYSSEIHKTMSDDDFKTFIKCLTGRDVVLKEFIPILNRTNNIDNAFEILDEKDGIGGFKNFS